MQITPVILSGGSGKRLWPLSRKENPKQFLSLYGDKTLLQETLLRLNGIENLADPIIICNEAHRFLVGQQCQQIGIKNPTILLEPVGKNTAPAIAAAALQSLKQEGQSHHYKGKASKYSNNSILLVLSADHIIQDLEAFHKAINKASQEAHFGRLVTFGIKPTNANVGYGYIKLSKKNINGVHSVKEFIEKPDLNTAKSFLEQEDYLWNSGMFMFQAGIFIDELKIHAPDIVSSVKKAVRNATKDLDFIRLEKEAFELSKSDSIDYALMEKSKNVVVVSFDAQWNDIGNWSALYDIGKKDKLGNVVEGDVITQDTKNSFIYSNSHLVVTLGVDNLVVVETNDVTFISSLNKAQEVGSILQSIEAGNRYEANFHRKVYRPWGWYDSIESGENFQVKRLHINPSAKLSLQSHQKRSEHWVVVNGIATVIKGDEIFILKKGESIFIPEKVKHSLANAYNESLEVIEVQSGTYLGEDDIIRFEDIYGRS